MNLTAVLVKHRNLAGVGSMQKGKVSVSHCAGCSGRGGEVKAKRNRSCCLTSLPRWVEEGTRSGVFWIWARDGLSKDRGWDTEPAGQACEVWVGWGVGDGGPRARRGEPGYVVAWTLQGHRNRWGSQRGTTKEKEEEEGPGDKTWGNSLRKGNLSCHGPSLGVGRGV